MKAKDITPGEAYAVEWGWRGVAKATVLEVPVVRMRRVTLWEGGKRKDALRPERGNRRDGAKVQVHGRVEWIRLAEVLHAWGEEDDARERASAEAGERATALRTKLTELGLPTADSFRGEAVSPAQMQVQLDFEPFEAWLKRIDPMEVAGSAIEAFIEAIERADPWTGLRDLAGNGRLHAAREAALQEMREGLAVSDAELTAEEV